MQLQLQSRSLLGEGLMCLVLTCRDAGPAHGAMQSPELGLVLRCCRRRETHAFHLSSMNTSAQGMGSATASGRNRQLCLCRVQPDSVCHSPHVYTEREKEGGKRKYK